MATRSSSPATPVTTLLTSAAPRPLRRKGIDETCVSGTKPIWSKNRCSILIQREKPMEEIGNAHSVRQHVRRLPAGNHIERACRQPDRIER
jgi:hypothetical protein